MTGAGFPHSDIHGSTLGRRLPVAFRSHPRPSSVSRRQGIHRWLFVAWKNKDARARYAILKGRSRRATSTWPAPSAARPASPGRLTETTSGTLPQNGTEDGADLPAATGEPKLYDRRRAARRPTSECINWESSCPTNGRAIDGLLRKEVIQPHLPVRLPCYDFTPIADPTFDSSLPKGLGHWLRVLPTFVV